MEKSRFNDLCAGTVFFLGSVWVFRMVLTMPKDVQVYSRIVAVLLLLTSGMLIVSALWNRNKPGGAEVSFPMLVVPAISLIFIIAYTYMITVIGFYVSSALFLAAYMWYLGARSVKSMALTVVCMLTPFYIIFSLYFRLPLPRGILF